MVDQSNIFVKLPPKSLKAAVAEWEDKNQPKKIAEEDWVDLVFKGINEIDSQTINSFQCIKLSISSNLIARLPELSLKNLQILSLSRNRLKYKQLNLEVL